MALHKDWMAGFNEPAIAHERHARQKLWVIVVYLDMQMSLITGQQPLLPQDDLPVGTDQYAPTSLEDCFDSILPRLLSTIHSFLARINSQNDQVTYAEARQYNLEIRQMMCQISDLPGSDNLRLTLDLFVCRALSILHGQFALACDARSLYPVSYLSFLDTNLAMMRHHQHISLMPRQSMDLALVAQPYMLDFFAAALSTCVLLLATDSSLDYAATLCILRGCVELIGKEESRSLCFRTGYHLLSSVFDLTNKTYLTSQ